ncbi:MAG: hypothetical protein WD768_02855 [Phycisphaeraceae bacterium]
MRRTFRLCCCLAILTFAFPAFAQERFKETRSLSQYVHHITLYDAAGVAIDPTSPNAKPYSPMQTCMKCHDYKSIAHGYHFNAGDKLFTDAAGKEHKLSDGRPGEPWIFSDARSGSQIPLSLRDWKGTHKPEDIGLTRLRYLVEFGRQMPGGGVGQSAKPQAAADADEARFNISGNLEIDCLICHSNDRSYSHERWMKQVSDQNFAWAATYALGIASVKGSAKTVPDDFDPAKAADPDAAGAAAGPKLPEVKYDKSRFDEEGHTFIDIIRTPSNNACYACHTTRPVGDETPAKWLHDEDVHVKAGIACAQCHRNDIGHHTVRGYEGEKHPTASDISSLSCRGCHLDQNDATKYDQIGGRLGAPKPLHQGIPPIHFDKMSCTSCHSGPLPKDRATGVQTAMAHAFGLATQTREDSDLPLIVQPVFRKNDQGVIYPYRQVWPAYFGVMTDSLLIKPMEPNQVYMSLRRSLRIRSDFRAEASKVSLTDEDRKSALGDAATKPDAELTAEQKAKLDALQLKRSVEKFRENLAKALVGLKSLAGEGKPVYISGGKVYELDASDENRVISERHPSGAPYAWPLAHDVRPARQSLGVLGCTECHAKDAPIFYSLAVAQGPAPDEAPITQAMHEIQGQDPKLMDKWELSFGGRAAFKWIGFIAIGTVAVIVALFALLTLGGFLKMFRPRGG